jgi:amino acid transporter/nucleotide-binding universal stress UspA family protein
MVEHTRSLGFRVAYAIGLGTMIAAGIFSLSGTAVALIGSSAVVAFVIAAAVAGITAASYSEFASIYSENGGGYLFSSRTFDHDLLTYAVGMLLFLGYTGTTAFYLATMDEWFVQFIIPQGWPVPHGAVGVVAAVLLGALNAQGTEESGSFQVLVTGAKVAVLFAFIGGAVSYAGPARAVGDFAVAFQFEPANIVSVAALAFITFFGFSAIAASAGEIIEPRKTVPKAIAASILTVTVLYTFVIVAMVNTPETIAGRPRAEVLQAGETAMGTVASAFLGPMGQSLIVAGAVFSMISASNASILAASGIGSLMGRQGQAPRPLSRVHPDFGTPFWSVTAATATIVALIAAFIGLFPAHRGALGIDLGLNALTGFATFNLLVPLSVVNAALVSSRRRHDDLDRPFTVPLVPWLPVLGILANLALITNLPLKGVAIGTGASVVLLGAYALWGGEPDREDLFQRVVDPEPVRAYRPSGGSESDAEEYRVLVPVARPSEAANHVHVAAELARAHRDDEGVEPFVQVVTVTQVPDQTPYETLTDTAQERVEDLSARLSDADLDVAHSVEGHLCRDVAFDVVQTARDDGADLVLMGFPEEHRSVAEDVQFRAPCDVVYTSGFAADEPFDTVTVGVGGGPHHRAMVPAVNALARRGTTVHVVRVQPTGERGTGETLAETVDRFDDDVDVVVHTVEGESIAAELVAVADEVGGPLFVGATRTRGLKRWLVGSVPDRVVSRAAEAAVPVLVYASATGLVGRATETLFPVYRYLLKQFGR